MDELHFPPPGACDCHVHVIGPKRRFPLVRERACTPKDAPADELRAMLAGLEPERVVPVRPASLGPTMPKWSTRSPTWAAVHAAVAVFWRPCGGI